MKKILITIAIQFIMLNLLLAQPVTPPQPPTPPDLSAQMQQLQQQMKDLQLQLQQMRIKLIDSINRKMIIINNDSTLAGGRKKSDKKIIIINGNRIDDVDTDVDSTTEEAMDDAMSNMNLYMQGMDSSTMKMYTNNDSVVINMGKMKLKMWGKDPHHPLRTKKDEEIIINNSDSTVSHSDVFKLSVGSFRLGVDNYLYKGKFKNAPGYDALELVPGKSIDVGIGIINARLHLIKNYLSLNSTLGIDISNYRFNSTGMLIQKADTVGFQNPTGDQHVTKNKLVASYIVLPVTLQFATSNQSSKAFRIGLGGRIGYLVGSHTKVIIDNEKIKQRDDFNLNVFKYGLEFTLGYGWLNFYVDYDLTPFFSDGVNPQLTGVSAGIILATF